MVTAEYNSAQAYGGVLAIMMQGYGGASDYADPSVGSLWLGFSGAV